MIPLNIQPAVIAAALEQLPDGMAGNFLASLPAPFADAVVREREKQPEAAQNGKPFTLADIVGTLTNTRWIWPGRLARGYLNMTAADPGVGKSAFVLGGIVPRIISDNMNTWPDGTPVDPDCKGLALWIDTEATQAMLLERAQAWGLPLDQICLPRGDGDLLADVALDTPVGRNAVLAVVAAFPMQLVVVDSLRGAFRGDENSSDVNELMAWLAALARDHQVAVLLIHHLKKQEDGAPRREITIDQVRGSSAITAMCRIIMAIDSPDPYTPDRKRLKVIKSNLGKLPPAIGFEVGDQGITFTDAPQVPRKETQQDKAADMLLTVLAHRSVQAKEVYERAGQDGIAPRTLEIVKKRLAIESVKKDGRWFWQLPQHNSAPGPLRSLQPLRSSEVDQDDQ